jgi:arabinose-5-phosphate isomerase
MHPVEARHGDLGIIQKNDLLIALSYSGETEELLVVLTPAKRLGVELVAITGNPESTLAKMSDLVVEMPVPREACPFNLAPTTTTTALLVLGDALALVLLDMHGFSKSDYGRLHPGGAIGRMVTTRAEDIMRKLENSALVKPESTVRETIYAMSHARCGSAIITDENNHLLGIFTDGDFRRSVANSPNPSLLHSSAVSSCMTASPLFVYDNVYAAELLKVFERRHIDDLPVCDRAGKVVGIVDIQDLPKMKVI